MNSWKKYPHLFANGKFKVNVDRNTMIAGNNPHVFRFLDGKVVIWSAYLCDNVTERIDDCTLIARPISDMTDNEVMLLDDFNPSYSIDWHKENLERNLVMGIAYQNDFIHLLSIGVYPFSQEHFGNEVIKNSE